MTTYTFHGVFNSMSKLNSLPADSILKIGRVVHVAPSYNDRPALIGYASDDWDDFVSTLKRHGVRVPLAFRDAPEATWPKD